MYSNLSVTIQRKIKWGASSFEASYNFSSKAGLTAAMSSSHDSRSLVFFARPTRSVFSMGTWSKQCAIFFVAGVVVGYTLTRGVRKWASKLLRRSKDN